MEEASPLRALLLGSESELGVQVKHVKTQSLASEHRKPQSIDANLTNLHAKRPQAKSDTAETLLDAGSRLLVMNIESVLTSVL